MFNYMGSLKKGMFIGALIGAGLVWLNTTKKGKEVREQILNTASDAYEKLKGEIKGSKQYQNLTKSEYVRMARKYVDKYAIENGLADNVKNMVMKIVTAQWNNLKSEFDEVK